MRMQQQTTSLFYQENHIDREHKVIGKVVPDDGSLKSDGKQYATKEELRCFWSTNFLYAMTKLKLLGCLLADIVIKGKKI